MPDIPFKGPNAFHCYNEDTKVWAFAFVLNGNLFVDQTRVYDRYNRITAATPPKNYHRGLVKSPTVGTYACWQQIAKDDLGSYTLYALETGYRDSETEEKLVLDKAVKNEQLDPGIWLIPQDRLWARKLDPGTYVADVHENGGYLVTPQVVAQEPEDPLAAEIEKYPAYWRPLPKHYKALDFYRVRAMFPLPAGYESARLDHSLKKLLIPGNRTGGKSVFKDLKEAHATLGQWLRDNAHLED